MPHNSPTQPPGDGRQEIPRFSFETPKGAQKAPLHAAPEAQARALEAELARMKESVGQAKYEAKLARLEGEEMEKELKFQKRRTTSLRVVAVVLAAALMGMFWYSFPLLKQHNDLLAQLPSMQELFNGVSRRVDSAEEKLRAWAGDRESLGDKMTRLENRVSSNLGIARKQAQEAAAQVGQSFQAQVDKHAEGIRARLGQIESAQDADRARLARIQGEVSGLRQEMTQQIAQARGETGRNLADLDQRVARTRRDLDAINDRMDRQRVDFEVAANRRRELAPGIYMTVTSINVSYQRVNGWLRLAPEGRTLWVRDQGIQQPMIFYSRQDDRPHELVLTRVTQNDVLGYLLVPRRNGTAARAPSGKSGEFSASVESPELVVP